MMSIYKRPAILIALLGILLTLFGSWHLYRAELKQVRRDFQQKAETLKLDLDLELRLSFEALYGLYGLFVSSEQVTPAEFERVAHGVARRHPEILALEWVPRLEAAERVAFEGRMNELYDDYRIWQPSETGQIEPAAERAVVYPIQYIYPLRQPRNLLGLDIGFEPARLHMLEQAATVRDLYVTDPIGLLRDQTPRKGFFALLPVFNEADTPEGFVRGVFGIQDLLDQLAARPLAQDMRLVLTDVHTVKGYETLYDNHADLPFDAEDAFQLNLTPSPGRVWTLLAAPLNPGVLQRTAIWAPLQVALVGVLLSTLVAYVIHLLQRRSEQVERLVERRTQELNELNATLARMSFTDELTGVANRRCFDQAFRKEWRRASRHRTSLGVILLDIDHFKGYNDSLGHQAGDDCLQRVAHCLRDQLKRPGDLLARYGGEEFILLLPQMDDGINQLAEKCRAAVEALQIRNPASHYGVLTISLGLSIGLPQPGKDPSDLIRAADQALYEAKGAGRNQIMRYDLG